MPRPEGLRAAALLAAARCLLKAAPQDQDSAHARRAVSTAYYAMFHCLARICADRLGNGRAVRLRPATRQVVYRAFENAPEADLRDFALRILLAERED